MRVTLNGTVASDDDLWLYSWFGISAFSPATVRQALAENPAGEDLVLEINSPGGSVFAGFEMYSALRAAEGVHTRAEVQSLSASASSTMMLGCDETWISPVAEVMIHLPSTTTQGDREAHRESIRLLDTITESILNGYEAKCAGRRSRDDLRRMMANATWLTAQDALDAGLVDGILYQDQPGAILPQNVTNAVGGGIRALAGSALRPDADWLRAEYERRVMAGAAPAEGHPVSGPAPAPGVQLKDDWRARARLNIENNRF